MSDSPRRYTTRHRLPVRVMHWLNALCILVLFMSGLSIFNAHPALYWGEDSHFDTPLLSMTGKPGADGQLRGETQIGPWRFDTTGVLGVSPMMSGEPGKRGFPSWATIPGPKSLAAGRRWHFFFAWLFVLNGLAYLAWSWRSRHLRDDLAPTKAEWRGIGASIREHLRFKHPTGEAALRYNILQKLAYLAVILILGPGVLLMGLAMSPHMDSVLGWMLDLVGGRQSARTWHFVAAFAFLAFAAIHLFMVLVTGPVNQVRAMITGRYVIHAPPAAGAATRDGESTDARH